MDPHETLLSDDSGVAALVRDLATQIRNGRASGVPIVLVGVKSRGVPIAERIAEILRESEPGDVLVGAVDITLYRDDLSKGDQWPVLKGTEIPFPVESVEVILVDDVLYTGRTVRAAMNCICDLGRPAAVRLAVLVDRGGRELPIRADYAGQVVEVQPGERIHVRLRPMDDVDEIVRTRDAATRP